MKKREMLLLSISSKQVNGSGLCRLVVKYYASPRLKISDVRGSNTCFEYLSLNDQFRDEN